MIGSESITQWLLVAMSLERLLVIYFPFRARFWGTGSHAIIVCIIVLLLASPVLATASMAIKVLVYYTVVKVQYTGP